MEKYMQVNELLCDISKNIFLVNKGHTGAEGCRR